MRTHVTIVLGTVALFAFAASADGQSIRGTVFDASTGRGVSAAAVYVMDRDNEPLAGAMTDSVGRFEVDVPPEGEFKLVGQRYGYLDMETPLFTASEERVYELDLEVQPRPLGIEGLTVTVRNEEVNDWLTLELGANPVQAFGFRLIQGDRLADARLAAGGNPTRTLRELYIPIAHGGACVSINSFPRAKRGGWRGYRDGQFVPGSVPAGTSSGGESVSHESGCGTLTLNDRAVPTEHIDEIDMSSISVVVTLPGTVRMYTHDFDWAFRRR